MSRQEFTAVIRKLSDMDASYAEIPFNVEKVFGKKRVKVKVWFDGELYRGTLMRMGMDCDWIGINQAIRKKIGKSFGDKVRVVIEEDTEERKVEIPADLMEILKKHKPELEYFQSLAYTHQKEYVAWILSAKREETRKSRLEKTLEMLRSRKKNPTEK